MEKSYRRPESAVQTLAAVAGPALATGAVHLLLLTAYLSLFGGDVSALVCVKRAFVGRYPFEAVRVGFDTEGFDGQYYYQLARDPFRAQGGETWIDPAYRHARLLYPLLAWALSGGDPERLLWVLPALNLVALMGLSLLGAVLARHYGRNAWWGFFLPLAVNAGMPILRDLTDPLATLAAFGLLTAWLLRWRPEVLTLWAVAAVFSREQNAALVLIVLLAAVTEGCRWRAAGLAAALLVEAGWLVFLRGAYGTWPFVAGNLGPPFAGMWHITTHASLIHTAGLVHLLLQVLLCGALLFVPAEPTTRLLALAGAALAVLGGAMIYESFDNYARVFVWMPLAIWLWALQSGRNWPMGFLAAWALWPAVALLQAWRMT